MSREKLHKDSGRALASRGENRDGLTLRALSDVSIVGAALAAT